MADVALLVGEWRMHEPRHQLGSGGLVRIVTGQAIRRGEGLVLVRLLQIGTLASWQSMQSAGVALVR